MKKTLPYNATQYYGFELTKSDFIVRDESYKTATAKTSQMTVQFF
ncbi:hypothetical protein A5881_003196 [Enterococcus termitis]